MIYKQIVEIVIFAKSELTIFMGLKLTTEQFIEKANKAHDNKYDYLITKYINMRTNISYICPQHGVQEQNARLHLKGSGCASCGVTNSMTQEEFIKKSQKIHNYKYDYTLTKFKNLRTFITYICPDHGIINQSSRYHLAGFGCNRCTGSLITHEDFIKKLKEKFGKSYNYQGSEYKNYRSELEINCPIHGKVKQFPSSCFKGFGCKLCNSSINIFSKESYQKLCDKKHGGLSNLYIIYCFNENERFYKIGITTQSIKRRYHNNKVYKLNLFYINGDEQ